MTQPRLHSRGAAGDRSCGGYALLTLLAVLGCGREAPRQAPPQNGKPAEPAPAALERKAEEPSGPAASEQDRAADKAPTAAPFAPPPPATPAPRPAKPAASKAAPGGAANALRRALGDGDDGMDWRTGAPASESQLLRQRLDEAVKLSTPDCPSARERKQAICDLANQICQLVDRDPDVASVESYCDDAKQRCSAAERRTAQRCK
jgi:hypothetical protein